MISRLFDQFSLNTAYIAKTFHTWFIYIIFHPRILECGRRICYYWGAYLYDYLEISFRFNFMKLWNYVVTLKKKKYSQCKTFLTLFSIFGTFYPLSNTINYVLYKNGNISILAKISYYFHDISNDFTLSSHKNDTLGHN